MQEFNNDLHFFPDVIIGSDVFNMVSTTSLVLHYILLGNLEFSFVNASNQRFE